MHVRRPEVAGELQSCLAGAIATYPDEIDSIIRKTWKAIYDVNPTNLKEAAVAFVKK